MATKTAMTEEQHLRFLIANLHSTNPGTPERKDVERDLCEWVDQHLRNNLRNIMLKVFGPQVASDTSLRFTNLWNDVVARVLKNGISDLQRDSTLKTLTTYFSIALANQARDYLKRRKRGEAIVALEIRPLVESCERHLREKHRLDCEEVLDAIDRWCAQEDPRGEVLRYYYIDGMSYAEIGHQMSLSPDQVKHLKGKALLDLKNRFADKTL